MMTSPDLMAMLPVDEEWAKKRRPHPWKMPFDPMYDDLKARSKDRILRTDNGIETPDAWKQYGQEPIVVRDDESKVLYVELHIKD
jgi:hypothetical protein